MESDPGRQHGLSVDVAPLGLGRERWEHTYRARCECGWEGISFAHDATARAEGEAHLRECAPEQTEPQRSAAEQPSTGRRRRNALAENGRAPTRDDGQARRPELQPLASAPIGSHALLGQRIADIEGRLDRLAHDIEALHTRFSDHQPHAPSADNGKPQEPRVGPARSDPV